MLSVNLLNPEKLLLQLTWLGEGPILNYPRIFRKMGGYIFASHSSQKTQESIGKDMAEWQDKDSLEQLSSY